MATNRRVDVEGVFTAPGVSNSARLRGNFNLSIFVDSGSPSFSMQLERSPDEGASWRVVPTKDGDLTYTQQTEERGFEPANYYLYRLNCTAVSGGGVGYSINR